jgi:hypothetical protein
MPFQVFSTSWVVLTSSCVNALLSVDIAVIVLPWHQQCRVLSRIIRDAGIIAMLSRSAPSGVLPVAIGVIGSVVGDSGKACHTLKEGHTEMKNSERSAVVTSDCENQLTKCGASARLLWRRLHPFCSRSS